MGLLSIKGQNRLFKGSFTRWQSHTSLSSPHWSIPTKRGHVGMIKNTRENGFYARYTHNESTMSQTRIAMLAIRVSYDMIQGPRSKLQSLEEWMEEILMEGELTMEELPMTLLAYFRMSQSR
ncbi:hypothetical protein Tco_1372577 [Tanacetum coccineum]